MADDGFDSGPAPQLFLDLTVDAALLAGAVDAQGLGRVQRIEFPAPSALPLGAQLRGPGQRLGKGGREVRLALGLAPDIADQTAQAGA